MHADIAKVGLGMPKAASASDLIRPVTFEEPCSPNRNFGSISNEAMLFTTFPVLKAKARPGVLLSIGTERGFDTLLNVPQLTELAVVDTNRKNVLLGAAMMELGKLHRAKYGPFTQVGDYLAYFLPENATKTFGLLGKIFNPADMELIRGDLYRVWEDGYAPPNPPCIIYSYLKYKSEQTRYNSWLSSPASLNKTLDRYEAGEIYFVNGDVAKNNAMGDLAKALTASGKVVSVADLTNVHFYFKEDSLEGFRQNFGLIPPGFSTTPLPIDRDKSLILFTHNSSVVPLIPDDIGDVPFLGRLFNGNSWGYYVAAHSYIRNLIAEDPQTSEVATITWRDGGIKCRNEQYEGFSMSGDSVVLVGL